MLSPIIDKITPTMSKHDYFTVLLTHHELILKSVAINGKAKTADTLNMSPQAFSTAYPMITAYSNIVSQQQEG